MTRSLANGGDQKNRRELDFYPTPPDVTEALMSFLSLEPGSVIWEPACGDGAMARVLSGHGHDVIATDLRVTGYGDGGIDFLAAEKRECDAVITNPPFNISEQFIRVALATAPVVAMVLKSQYWHAQKRHKLFNDVPPAWILPLTWRPDFLFDQREIGKTGSPTMDCIWTVWVAGDTETKYRPLARPDRKPAPKPEPITNSQDDRQFDLLASL